MSKVREHFQAAAEVNGAALFLHGLQAVGILIFATANMTLCPGSAAIVGSVIAGLSTLGAPLAALATKREINSGLKGLGELYQPKPSRVPLDYYAYRPGCRMRRDPELD